MVIASSASGLEVASAVARLLELPVKIITSQTIPHPANDNIAVGSVSSGGTLWLEEDMAEEIDTDYIEKQYSSQHVKAREKLDGYPAPEAKDLNNKRVIIVEEGIDTGIELLSVIGEVRKAGASEITVGLPFAPRHRIQLLEKVSNRVVCIETPRFISSIEECYESRTAGH